MLNKPDWDETKDRFRAFWAGRSIGRPLLDIRTRREQPLEELEPESPPADPAAKYTDIRQSVIRERNRCRSHAFLGEAFPFVDLYMVPCAMALFQGCEPVFEWDTAWHRPCVTRGWSEFGALRFDPSNRWWRLHLELLKAARDVAGDEILISMPDLLENVDVLSLMRGVQEFCYDLVDERDLVRDYVRQLDDLYFRYNDALYAAVRDDAGGSCSVVFNLWSPGRIGKLQCDFSAMMSPDQFREFVVPSIRRLVPRFEHAFYHLDGKDCIKHIEAILGIEQIRVIQWTPGAGQAGVLDETWYPLFDRIRGAGRGLWLGVSGASLREMVQRAEKFVHRYGSSGIFLRFPELSESEGKALLQRATRHWA
jgi:hypothetical protein